MWGCPIVVAPCFSDRVGNKTGCLVYATTATGVLRHAYSGN
jgi:hypothetical protein